MYTCQKGHSSGVLLKDVAVFRRCPLAEVSLYIYLHTRFQTLYSCIITCTIPKHNVWNETHACAYTDTLP